MLSVDRRSYAFDAVQEQSERHRFAAMVDSPGGYISRRPRHRAALPAGLQVRIERVRESVSESVEVELLDLSRTGVRLRTPVPLAVGESITMRLQKEESGLRLTRSGTVRWTSVDQGGTWSAGCLFSQPVDWEELGELFLSGVLSTDRPMMPPADPTPAAPPASGAEVRSMLDSTGENAIE